jgi:Ni/Co efflux regulator RcnB
MRNKLAFNMLAVTTAFPVAAQNWTPRDGAANSASEGQRHRAARADQRAQPRAPAANRGPAPNRVAQDRDGRRDLRPNQTQSRSAPARNLRPGESFPGRDPQADRRVEQMQRARNAPGYNNNRGRDYRPGNNDRGRWNNNWRNDQRYDWRNYRSSNRNHFRVPRYQAPRGYSYRRWAPGYRLQPFFYARSYWIMDPWQYRLPPAYGPYQWVRYYDDVLLVDITTGTVVDVIPDFFWN